MWSPTTVVRTGTYWNFDIAPDGKRVVTFPQSTGAEGDRGPVHVTVLVNFWDELRRKAPVK